MESLANFIGREGFNWWVGQVENDGAKFWNAELDGGAGDFDYGDWDWTNKVKVRIIGYHTPNRKELPTSDLPWAQVLMPPIYSQRSVLDLFINYNLIVGLLDSSWMAHQHRFLLSWEVLVMRILLAVMA